MFRRVLVLGAGALAALARFACVRGGVADAATRTRLLRSPGLLAVIVVIGASFAAAAGAARSDITPLSPPDNSTTSLTAGFVLTASLEPGWTCASYRFIVEGQSKPASGTIPGGCTRLIGAASYYVSGPLHWYVRRDCPPYGAACPGPAPTYSPTWRVVLVGPPEVVKVRTLTVTPAQPVAGSAVTVALRFAMKGTGKPVPAKRATCRMSVDGETSHQHRSPNKRHI